MGISNLFKSSAEKEREQVFKRIASIKDDVLLSSNYNNAVTELQSLLNNHPAHKMTISAEIKKLEEIIAVAEEQQDERSRIANLWRLDHIIEQKTADKDDLMEEIENNPENIDELYSLLEAADADLERAITTKDSIVEMGKNPNIRIADDPIQRIQDDIVNTYIRLAKRRKERAAPAGGIEREEKYAELQRLLEEGSPTGTTQDLFKNIKTPSRKRVDPNKAERRAKLDAEMAKRRAAKDVGAGDKNTVAIREKMTELDSKIDSLNS